MIVDHFCPFSPLLVTLIAICSSLTESDEIALKRYYRDKDGPNLSYLDTITNRGSLYTALEQI